MTHVLITTDAVGGVWTYSLALASGFATRGIGCTLAVLGPAPDSHQLAGAAAIGGCGLIHTGLDLDWQVDSRTGLDVIIDGLGRLAGELDATSVHLHAPCLATGQFPVPVVAVAHSCMASWWSSVRGTALPESMAWHRDATAEGLRRADRLVSPTGAFAAQLAQCYGLTRSIDVIHNGANPGAPSGMARQDVVLAAGRVWDESKNMATLDQAARLMRSPVHAAGPTAAPSGGDIALPNLELLGTLRPQALRRAMYQAGVFAAPSRYEPFGLAVLEAAQTGAPLVLADIATFRELWDGAALFVSPDDPPGWARTLDGLMEDGACRSRLGRAARERAGRYTRAAMVAATAQIHAGLPARDLRAA